jgi:hypothetical protein
VLTFHGALPKRTLSPWGGWATHLPASREGAGRVSGRSVIGKKKKMASFQISDSDQSGLTLGMDWSEPPFLELVQSVLAWELPQELYREHWSYTWETLH